MIARPFGRALFFAFALIRFSQRVASKTGVRMDRVAHTPPGGVENLGWHQHHEAGQALGRASSTEGGSMDFEGKPFLHPRMFRGLTPLIVVRRLGRCGPRIKINIKAGHL